MRLPLGCSGVALVCTAALFGLLALVAPNNAPDGPENPAPPVLTASIFVLVPTALAFAFAATRHLWRAKRRAKSFLPPTLLPLCLFIIPALTRAIGLPHVAILSSVPAALLLSTLLSIALLVSTLPPREPAA
jgi:hypothetical protein